MNLANLFSQKGIENTSVEFIPEDLKEMYIKEANQYLYYKDVLGDHEIDEEKIDLFLAGDLENQIVSSSSCAFWK